MGTLPGRPGQQEYVSWSRAYTPSHSHSHPHTQQPRFEATHFHSHTMSSSHSHPLTSSLILTHPHTHILTLILTHILTLTSSPCSHSPSSHSSSLTSSHSHPHMFSLPILTLTSSPPHTLPSSQRTLQAPIQCTQYLRVMKSCSTSPLSSPTPAATNSRYITSYDRHSCLVTSIHLFPQLALPPRS